jgi:hypothetical protein
VSPPVIILDGEEGEQMPEEEEEDLEVRRKAVFRIRIRIHRIHIFLGLPDPDLLGSIR